MVIMHVICFVLQVSGFLASYDLFQKERDQCDGYFIAVVDDAVVTVQHLSNIRDALCSQKTVVDYDVV